MIAIAVMWSWRVSLFGIISAISLVNTGCLMNANSTSPPEPATATASAQAAADAATAASIRYVEALGAMCIYEDGYRCRPAENDNFLTAKSLDRMVPAPLIHVWSTVWQDFQSIEDLSDAQKALHHYRVGFSDDPDHVIVVLAALLMPAVENGEPIGLSTVTFGRSTRYRVSKATGEVVERLFYK